MFKIFYGLFRYFSILKSLRYEILCLVSTGGKGSHALLVDSPGWDKAAVLQVLLFLYTFFSTR